MHINNKQTVKRRKQAVQNILMRNAPSTSDPIQSMLPFDQMNAIHQQECIPVGCVPSTTVAVCFGGVSSTPPPPRSRHPPGARPPEQAPRGPGTPPDQAPPLETCCKACWDTTCNACWDSTPLAARHAGIPPARHARIPPPLWTDRLL